MSEHSGVRRRRRGEPLMALVLLLGGWTGARIMLWESPFARAAASATSPNGPTIALPAGSRAGERVYRTPATASLQPPSALPLSKPTAPVSRLSQVLPQWSGPSPATMSTAIAAVQPTGTAGRAARPYIVQPSPIIPARGASPWRLAAWAAWRQGSGLPKVANGPRPASYGGTQLGALLQFDLANGPRRPALHVRATYAPDRPRQSEIAAGAGLRPVASVPVRILGEVRATRGGGQVEVRPAVLAVTEFPPVKLPLGLIAEGYAQGGWVGGRYATAFADGQARVTHEVTGVGPARIRLGVGAWGGAQKFASRLDAGPSIAVDVGGGAISARLSMDYRMRVAGNASPGDGVALTLSTGF